MSKVFYRIIYLTYPIKHELVDTENNLPIVIIILMYSLINIQQKIFDITLAIFVIYK